MSSQRLAACVDHEDPSAAGHLPNALNPGFDGVGSAAGRLSDALDPGFHGVRTQWIRGFMAFQPTRSARTVELVVLE
jgi:hypothetical protein